MVLSLILGLLMETECSSSSNSVETREEQYQRVCPVCINLHGLSTESIICEKCIIRIELQWEDHRRDASDAESKEQRNISSVIMLLSVALIVFFFCTDVMCDCWTWAIGSITNGISTKDDK